ncbi:hypothetical protein GQ600_21197 [Phytophthora cactorum]|nr:hypothetical protein GQ600_21197 [Phytophthora cactorum]
MWKFRILRNVLNALFIENSDLLLYVCGQFNSEQSSETTFLSLVAIAIRRNVAHCQSFLSPTAQTLLRSVFDAGIQKCTAQPELQGSLIYFASLVSVRLARSPIDDNVLNGLELFSRISFEMLPPPWIQGVSTDTAENLILSCGCDPDTREEVRYEALFSASNVAEQGLTIVETLLMFLGRTSTTGSDIGGVIEGLISYDSYDRLAATILASLSELNALRLTYYSSIRAGVRTGIIPPQCSGVFQRIDQEHLLPSESSQKREISSSPFISTPTQSAHCVPSKYLQPEDTKFDSELRELILFTNEHAELLSVLTVNRKKALTSAIRVATQNARVLMAFHSMTSLALDFYIDTAKKLQNQKKSKHNSKRRVSAIVNIGNTEQTVFLEWLLLLEQLAGLLCSGLHELDAAYYIEIVSQFRSLILDLPLFLRKMERMGTHSRQEALMLFLDNLHRLVKRATSRNELRVVAANGSGIVDQTKSIRARLRKLDIHISISLAALLEAREGMENLSRLLLAMQYMWRRMMGTTSVEKAMASSRESISLLKKIKEKFVSFTHTLRRPRAVFGARRETSAATEFDSPSELLKASQGTESVSTDQSSQSSSEYDEFGVTGRNSTRFSSLFPFTSLDLLLDHFGWESVAAKRTRQLLQSSRNKNDVIEVLKSTFGIGEEAVEQMTPLDLAEKFQELEETKKISDGLDQLQQLIIENDMPFENFPFVVHDKVEMSLWRLMVRPIQRVRLFHLYHQTQRFVLSDPTKRRIILESYRQVSPQRPVIHSVLDRLLRGVILVGARLILLIAFWRQEELRTDLKDPIMAKAFDDPHARDEYYRLYHAKKGLGELRNTFMTRIVYGYGIGIFLLAVVSIALIAQSTPSFFLFNYFRVWLTNSVSLCTVGADSIASPTSVPLLPKRSGRDCHWSRARSTQFSSLWTGIHPMNCRYCGMAGKPGDHKIWILVCCRAGGTRSSAAVVVLVFTAEMRQQISRNERSTASCTDQRSPCIGAWIPLHEHDLRLFLVPRLYGLLGRAQFYLRKVQEDPQSPPFLIAHKEITCWTAEHQWYALLALGYHFLPTYGLLAHGMSQVLFQRETLDIKYAPVLILVVQLVKAAAATLKLSSLLTPYCSRVSVLSVMRSYWSSHWPCIAAPFGTSSTSSAASMRRRVGLRWAPFTVSSTLDKAALDR